MQPEKPIIAAFDFDGTITSKDTLFDFIAFYRGRTKLLLGLAVLSPVLVLYALRVIKNSTAKQLLFAYFFKYEDSAIFDSVCRAYSERITAICRPDVLALVEEHLRQGHKVVIVSASIDRWITPWAEKTGIDSVIATTLRINDNRLTGRFLSKNCYGQEKVNRFLERFPDRGGYTLFSYGDSSGDNELLALADHARKV
jgi:HAD superfamily hydrolase (TIGR01490 family)